MWSLFIGFAYTLYLNIIFSTCHYFESIVNHHDHPVHLQTAHDYERDNRVDYQTCNFPISPGAVLCTKKCLVNQITIANPTEYKPFLLFLVQAPSKLTTFKCGPK